MLRVLAILLAIASCGDDTTPSVAKGGKCVASSECETGLLCDSATHTCLGMGTIDADLFFDAPKPDAAAPAVDAM